MVAVVLLMAATLAATFWMARQQDRAAGAAAQRMVQGGMAKLVETAKSTLLDYAIWTDAYDRIRAGDIDWIDSNIGASAATPTFDLVIIQSPDGTDYGWDAAGGPKPELLDADVLAAVGRLLDAVPIESGTAEVGYFRSGRVLWLLAAARVIPQEKLPAGVVDAEVARLVIGFRITAELLDGIARRFGIEHLMVGTSPIPGAAALPLAGVDGSPVAWLSWESPTPGRAVLRATLLPLVGLMVAVGGIVFLVSRELVGSAQRLETALAQARAADRTKSEFLSNVSHELRTPLNGVIGIAQLLQLRKPDAEEQHMLELLLACARGQLRLINGLLDITRIEAGTLTLDQIPFQPAIEIEDTVQLIRPEIEAKRLSVSLEIAPEACRPVVGDALALRQIASNLISNALKFTERGGITVRLGTNQAGALVLVVSDTGIGIDSAEHARIFERFTQVEETATRRVGGTGIGLAITLALVQLQGGAIRVRSALGEGATFIVELPLPAAGAMASAA